MNLNAIAIEMARRIEIWPIDRLKPYSRNARTHSDEQVAQIAASMVEFGFCNPILVDTNEGIVAGHGRLLAARKLRLAECPVVVLDHLTEDKRRAYIVADNKIAENAGWDTKLLAKEMDVIRKSGIPLEAVGFTDAQYEDLLAETEVPQEHSDVEETIPEEPATPVTRLGDVWLIGKHRLICGDCRDRNTVGVLFPSDARANLRCAAYGGDVITGGGVVGALFGGIGMFGGGGGGPIPGGSAGGWARRLLFLVVAAFPVAAVAWVVLV